MRALSYIPVHYPDELVHSVIARFMMHTLLSLSAVKRDIFGSELVVCPLYYPTSVNKFVERGLYNKEECDELLRKNTLLPYLLFAVDSKTRDEIYSSIWGLSPHSWTIVNVLGFSGIGHKYTTPNPKYCPVCTRENLETYGEIYWNRYHQIPGIGYLIIMNYGATVLTHSRFF